MKEVHHGTARETKISKDDYLWKNLPSFFDTGRYHSWAVDKKSLPNVLETIAEDSLQKTIMAFRHKHLDCRGIQFHPESILTENGLRIIKNWVLQ